MRRPLIFLFLAFAVPACADHVITVPRGGKIPVGVIRGEYLFEASRPSSSLSFLGFGINSYVDAEIAHYDLRHQVDTFTELNLTFNLNAPLAGFAPGISLGVLDAADQSPQGFRGFFAVSFQDGGGGPVGGGTSVEATVGAIVGEDSFAFVGLILPVSERFRFLVEHDGFQINAGAELRLQQGPFFKLVFYDQKTLLSAGASVRF